MLAGCSRSAAPVTTPGRDARWGRAVEDARLTARIRELHKKRREVYGSPSIWSDLVLDDGERIGRKRVERLMRQAGLSGLIVKKWKATTVRVPWATKLSSNTRVRSRPRGATAFV